MFVLEWLENHQVVAASLINVSVVLIVAFFTNQWQLRRENQRWQREKLYDIYNESQQWFLALLKSRGSARDSYRESFYGVTSSLSKLTLVCSEKDLEEINSIRDDLINLIQPNGSSSFTTVDVIRLYPLNERLNKVIASDLRLKDLFK